AGAAAAVAANRGVQPRAVDVGEVRQLLRQQGAHLSDDAAVAGAQTSEAVPAE
ncbi:FAD-dependent oxidoreductase, partial [Altererythrobacter soli]|nr:FAD-dependent oxidoreductase [Croceibacterium soli]